MTEKELRRLRRPDLLQLLLAQGKEAVALQAQLEERSAELAESQAMGGRLKEKLDEKDARIRELESEMQAWLDSRRIELDEAGSIAEAALRLNGIFEDAQKAADQYLYNLQQMCEKRDGQTAAVQSEKTDPGK